MSPELSAIERRLDELNERLQRLEPLKTRTRREFAQDAYLRDIVERNLEVAAQCCLDIANRIISVEQARKPQSYREAILRLGDLDVLPNDFATGLAPIAGFRNILVHEYLMIDWDEVYSHLGNIDDLYGFVGYIQAWLRQQSDE